MLKCLKLTFFVAYFCKLYKFLYKTNKVFSWNKVKKTKPACVQYIRIPSLQSKKSIPDYLKVIWENAKSVQSCYQKEVKKCYFEIAKDSFLLHYFNFHLSFQNFADLKCEKSRIVQIFDCYCKENYMMMRKKKKL